MDPEDRNKILTNVEVLTQHFDIDKIINSLLQWKVFTAPMIEDIQIQKTEILKKKKLLKELCTRGPKAFQHFIEILKETGHFKAAQILSSNEVHEVDNMSSSGLGSRPQEIINLQLDKQNWSSNTLNDGSCCSAMSDRREQVGGSKKDEGAKKVEKVHLAEQWIEDKMCYKVHSFPRGLCLIINNVDFAFSPRREGSQRDAIMLIELFTQLNYKVVSYENKTAWDIKDTLLAFSRKEEQSYLDSCIVIIMSHGGRNFIKGTDEVPVRYEEDIFELFNNKNCAALIGKPKIFLFQACRGNNINSGLPVVQIGGGFRDGSRKISEWSDILAAYCTTDRYVANRNPVFGSWFMQELISVLMEKACDTDLLTMLQEVDVKVRKITNRFGDKQTPDFLLRGFHKKVYFNPGLQYTDM